jgi:acylphosphatase
LTAVIRRFLVFGKVQGVFFRHSTRLEAERLGLRGLARNLADGSVEVLAQGSTAALEELRVWLGHGPPQARVDGVRETSVGETGGEAAAGGIAAIPEGFSTL